jgi:hypothetical protein
MAKMTIDVPPSTAMMVFVAADGIIIEALDSNGQGVEQSPESNCPLIGSKFGSSCAQPSAQTAQTSMERAVKTQTAACCWRMVNGRWICKPEYC